MATAPSPISAIAGAANPATKAAMPPPATAPPKLTCRRSDTLVFAALHQRRHGWDPDRAPGRTDRIEQLGLLAPASRVLVLTRSEENRVVEAIIAGASGYILKTAPPNAIISAVKATAAGESVLSPQVAGKLLQRIRELDLPVKTSGSTATAIRAALTERELEIFTQLASGNSNHQIAHDLSLSTFTVANHIASILAKLHLENRIQAAVQAVRSGIS